MKRDLVLLGHVFEVARKEWGTHVQNPVRDITLPPGGRPRDRRLQHGEEARLFDACRAARNRWLLPLVQLAIETATRQGERLLLRWEYIDRNRGTAYLPNTKNGEARTLALLTTAFAVLHTLPRALHGEVFPGVTTEAVKRFYMRSDGPASKTSASTTCALRRPPACSRRDSTSWRSRASPGTRICACCGGIRA